MLGTCEDDGDNGKQFAQNVPGNTGNGTLGWSDVHIVRLNLRSLRRRACARQKRVPRGYFRSYRRALRFILSPQRIPRNVAAGFRPLRRLRFFSRAPFRRMDSLTGLHHHRVQRGIGEHHTDMDSALWCCDRFRADEPQDVGERVS